MTGDDLRNAIRELIATHPDVGVLPIGHTKKTERYGCANGARFALDLEGRGHINLYVNRADVDLSRLSDIHTEAYMLADIVSGAHGLHSNVLTKGCLDSCDVVRVKLNALWQAARVLRMVAGEGAGK
jgi:hypothetical protein